MAKLVLSTEGAVVDQCFMDDALVTIGRGAYNRIVVDDPAIGVRHASISAVGHDYILEDLGSGAGIPVNGALTKRRILQHGDVIELGSYHLKYVDSKASSEIDLERTMIISGLKLNVDVAPATDSGEVTQDLHVPSSRATKTHFPNGRIKWLQGPHGGEYKVLDRVIATFGAPDTGLAVVTRRPHGFYVTYVEGAEHPRVNGESIGKEPRHLQHLDIVEVGEERVEFQLF
jgi:hypothetical protein